MSKARGYTKETIATMFGQKNRNNFPDFKVGDCIEVGQRIREGDKERVQMFEGDVIAIRNHGESSTFTVRRIGAHNVAIERIFPYASPRIASIRFVHHGDVRRAKLFFIRRRVGKAARVAEKVLTREQKEAQNSAASAA